MKAFSVIITILTLSLSLYYFYPEGKLERDVVIHKIIVLKAERKLLAYSDGKLVQTYRVSLGKNPIGDKQYEGDNRTPEGIYKINDKNANSGWHTNLGISYPDAADSKQARLLGRSPGGDIKIHGLKNGRGFIGKFHRWKDWTQGCIALTDKEVDELFGHVPVGTTIEIKP
ncbi:L,D-transpeptidase family protein [Desertivirga arenae]|uniref:L,D-transpeptidase family protein n=1 Tax=Desertivirga arenae TaxID=2810309 RepID=UPI001A97075B|nr:L,D-transpeptidase family protein [Pedobacter sp. SYSU D00823]